MHHKRKKAAKVFLFSTFLLIISFGLVLLFLKFGIPLIINLSSFFFKFSSPKQTEIYQEILPKPVLFYDYEATNSSSVLIKGKAYLDGKVKIVLNGEDKEKMDINKDNEFLISLLLSEGKNDIYAVSENSKGQVSLPSEVITIYSDISFPSLEIISPASESRYSGSSQKTLVISGQAEENSIVFINNRQVIVKKNGEFSHPYPLSEGENIILVVAKDKAGNTTEKELVVYFNL